MQDGLEVDVVGMVVLAIPKMPISRRRLMVVACTVEKPESPPVSWQRRLQRWRLWQVLEEEVATHPLAKMAVVRRLSKGKQVRL
jgi:hypothetical protein